MKHPRPAPGFTLIELLVLIVVFAGSVVALLSVAIDAGKRVGENKDYALAAQLAQEQAERVLAVRRAGYGLVADQTLTAVPGYSGFSRSALKTTCTSGQMTTWGLDNGCTVVNIVVNRGAGTPTLASITLLLANYN